MVFFMQSCGAARFVYVVVIWRTILANADNSLESCELPRHQLAAEYCGLNDPSSILSKYIETARRSFSALETHGGVESETAENAPKFLIWLHSQGGLADQLKKIANAFIAAVDQGRVLLLNSTKFEIGFGPGLVDWRYSVYRGSLPAHSLSPKCDVDDEGPDSDAGVCLRTDLSKEPVLVQRPGGGKDFTVKQWRSSYPPGFDLGCLVHAFFRPTAALCRKLTPWIHAFREKTVTAVYIRMRDAFPNGMSVNDKGVPPDVTERIGIPLLRSGLGCARGLVQNSRGIPLAPPYIQRQATDRAREGGKGTVTLFLTDDDWLRKVVMADAYKLRGHDGKLLVTTNVTPCHTDSCKLPTADNRADSCNASDLDRIRQCYLEAVTDYLLLASADHVVMATGGFGITAASVGFIPPERRTMSPGCLTCQPHGWCVDQTWWEPGL